MNDVPDADGQPAESRSASRSSGSRGQIFAKVLLILSSVISLIVAVLWILFDADTWIFVDINSFTKVLGVVLGSQALVVAGLMWVIPALFALRVKRLRTRWLAVPPAIVLLGAIALAAIPTPDFSSSRDEIEHLAATASSHPPGWKEHYGFAHPIRAGHLEVRHLTHRDDGVILVGDADMAVAAGDSGWARSPQGPPAFGPGTPGLQVEHLDGPWYRYSYSD